MEIRPLKTCSLALVAMFALSGCGEKAERIEITEKRKLQPFEQRPVLHASSSQRFSLDELVRLGKSRFDMPSGWRDAGPDRMKMRIVNLSFGVNAEGECYVSRASGSVEANANRWRGQMGLPAATPEEIAALPKQQLLGEEAVMIDIEGDFTGMAGPHGGAAPKEDYRMLGLILEREGEDTVFVKLTGPKDLVAEHKDRFHEFCESLQLLD